MGEFSFALAFAYGAMAGAMIVALSYMAGRALNSQKLLAYSKSELGELVFSAILLALISFALLNSASMLQALSPPSFSTQTSADGVQKAIFKYMEQPLMDAIEVMAKSSMRLSKIVSYNFNYNISVPYVGGPWGSASPGAGGAPLQLALTTGIDTSAMSLFLASAIKLIFIFLYTVCQFLLIPLGFFLRFIPPARQVGSLLIAISIATIFIFPASVFWSAEILGKGAAPFVSSQIVPDADDADWLKTLICNKPLQVVNTIGEDILGAIVGAIACAISGPGFAACFGHESTGDIPIPDATSGVSGWSQFGIWLGKKIAGIAGSLEAYNFGPEASEVLEKGFDPIAYHIMPRVIERNIRTILMAIFQLMATIVVAKNLAQALGAEGQLYGLSKMV
ncbi:hypothetical protein COU37_04345 [Candidatus Micrarchaeota archaeon CG10_big_fil_rev_8_21_14_0_10_45_29]|nr:MAG: hypothetical protein COU37_04345 [Candidatus Micrarchaeota archaeon CG10_big_fil_rev_8_21_14_0_10_45_29]